MCHFVKLKRVLLKSQLEKTYLKEVLVLREEDKKRREWGWVRENSLIFNVDYHEPLPYRLENDIVLIFTFSKNRCFFID